jgi:hypothetical protein
LGKPTLAAMFMLPQSPQKLYTSYLIIQGFCIYFLNNAKQAGGQEAGRQTIRENLPTEPPSASRAILQNHCFI